MNSASFDTHRPDLGVETFDRFVRGDSHPCVMARSVMSRRAARFGQYGALGSQESAAALCRDLVEALDETRAGGAPWSFVAVFDQAAPVDEAEFERLLWQQLQAMHDYDCRTYGWDPTVEGDPGGDKFSFSIGGKAWYVIGLHPAASRIARRFESVALVFNPHAQFEQLRVQGKYDIVKTKIRERDAALQGTINPMLADHGERSEARQYSGRAVGDDWRCPFHRNAAA